MNCDLFSYDKILVGFSGGKDSVAAVCTLLDAGVDRSRIELHHHDIDGDGASFMDWPITKDYCRQFARAMGLPIYFSWRDGGFEREMLRDEQRTAAVIFEQPDGTRGQAGGVRGPLGTRRKFPQVSASLTTRWCSGTLKVDVMAAAVRNQPRFTGLRTLVVTGERAEESTNRANYAVFEADRAHSTTRHVDHLRPVHGPTRRRWRSRNWLSWLTPPSGWVRSWLHQLTGKCRRARSATAPGRPRACPWRCSR